MGDKEGEGKKMRGFISFIWEFGSHNEGAIIRDLELTFQNLPKSSLS